MTRDEAVSIIQTQLGFRSDLATQIITQLKFAQQVLESNPTKPWFLVTEDAYIRTLSGDDRVPVPSDFIQEVDSAVLHYVPDTVTALNPEVDLKKDDYDVLRQNYRDTSTGTIKTGPPEAYCLLGNYFRIFPTPDDDYLLRQIYMAPDTVLSSNIENNWLLHFPYLLIGKAGVFIASALRDSAALATFMQWEIKGQALLVQRTYERELANEKLQVGGPE